MAQLSNNTHHDSERREMAGNPWRGGRGGQGSGRGGWEGGQRNERGGHGGFGSGRGGWEGGQRGERGGRVRFGSGRGRFGGGRSGWRGAQRGWRGSRGGFSGPSTSYVASMVPVVDEHVFIGDSIFLRMVKEVNQTIPGSFSLCHGGATIDNMNVNVKNCSGNILVQKNVVVLMGTNDILQGGTAEDVVSMYKLLIENILCKEVKSVNICTLPMLFLGELASVVEAVNTQLMNMANMELNIAVIDCEKIFLNSDGTVNEEFYERFYEDGKKMRKDYIHPNPKGLQHLYKYIKDSTGEQSG